MCSDELVNALVAAKVPDPFKELIQKSDEAAHNTALEVAIVEADADVKQKKIAEAATKRMVDAAANDKPPHYKQVCSCLFLYACVLRSV